MRAAAGRQWEHRRETGREREAVVAGQSCDRCATRSQWRFLPGRSPPSVATILTQRAGTALQAISALPFLFPPCSLPPALQQQLAPSPAPKSAPAPSSSATASHGGGLPMSRLRCNDEQRRWQFSPAAACGSHPPLCTWSSTVPLRQQPTSRNLHGMKHRLACLPAAQCNHAS